MSEDILSFDGRYPHLKELLDTGGVPGVSYAYVLGQNIVKAQREGWDNLHRMRGFSVSGPAGEVSMVLMGRGKPITGASPDSCRPQLEVDKEADIITGLGKAAAEVASTEVLLKAEPEVSEPKAKLTLKATEQVTQE